MVMADRSVGAPGPGGVVLRSAHSRGDSGKGHQVSNPYSSTPSGWYPDPSGRHERRYWDGAQWTAHVCTRSIVGTDDPNGPARPAAPPVWSPGPVNSAPQWSAQSAPWSPGAVATVTPPPPPGGWAPVSPYPAQYPTQPRPPLASLGQRLGAHLLDAVLCLVTLFVGWLIWSCFTYSRGQTPAKSIMGLRVVKQQTGWAATWGDMFVRNVVVQGGMAILSMFLFGIPTIVAVVMIFSGPLHQTGWDRMVGTVVVNDPSGATVPAGR